MNIPIMAILPTAVICWFFSTYRRWTGNRVLNLTLLWLGIIAVMALFLSLIYFGNIEPNNRTFTGRG